MICFECFLVVVVAEAAEIPVPVVVQT